MRTALAIAVGIYLAAMLGLALFARGRIVTHGDYLVAGRRLSLPLVSLTLLATWFGAGTILTATDEMRAEGLRVSALEPLGAGCALLLAGAAFARPLWRMGIYTFADFHALVFGRKAEVAYVLTSVPAFVGWIAVQLVALAGILELFFDIPLDLAIAATGLFALIYTLLGGMWSVTLTDAVQVVLVVAGLALIALATFAEIGGGAPLGGLLEVLRASDAEHRTVIPVGELGELASWLGLFLTGAVGNISSQDLGQRIFSARSAGVARAACLIGGIVYIFVGALPMGLALASDHLLAPDITRSVVPAMAEAVLAPAPLIVFVLALISLLLSTIDSAILAPASTLANNLLRHLAPARITTLALCRLAVVLVAAASVGVAYLGERAFTLLESAYAIGLVAFFAPLVAGLYLGRGDQTSAMLAMATGVGVWAGGGLADTELPVSLLGAAASFVAFAAHAYALGPPRRPAAWSTGG